MARALALALLIVLAGAVPASAGVVSVAPASAQADDPAPGPSDGNETVTRHRDPEAVSGRGDAERVRQWLTDRLAGRLGNGTVQLSQRQYDLAREVIGDRYGRRLDQLVDVAGETDATRAFERTRERQRELVNRTQRYNETRRAFERARENENTSRARRLARELERVATDVNESARRTVAGYRRLGAATNRSFEESVERVNETAAGIAAEQAEIRAALFVETRLTVSAPREAVSFANPLPIEGRLVAVDGPALADRTVTIHVGARRYRVRTDDEGRFELSYRPVRVPVEVSTLSVGYRPAPEAAYANATATLPVAITAVQPTVDVGRTPSSVGFGDRLAVSGRVRAAGVAVPGLPLAVSVGGTRVGTVPTGPNGSYSAASVLPAGVAAGDRTVRVGVAQEGRAVAAAGATTNVTVVETETTLTIEAAADGRTIRVTGRLATADGEAVPGRSVAVSLNGSAASGVRTGGDGRFVADVSLPSAAGSVVVVGVRFDAAGTNLRDARTEERVAIGGRGGDGADTEDGDDAPGDGGPAGVVGSVRRAAERAGDALGLVGVAVVALLGGLLVLGIGALVTLRRVDPGVPGGDDGDGSGDGAPPTASGATATAGTEEPAGGPGTAGPETGGALSLLEQARAALENGDADGSVVTAYTAGRDALAGRLREADVLTHWEFYAAVRDGAGTEEEVATLRELTEAYEEAAYAFEAATTELAGAALAAAGALVDGDGDGDESD